MGDEENRPPQSEAPQQAESDAHPAYLPSVADDSLWQGEILTDLKQLKVDLAALKAGADPLKFLSVNHSFVVVLSRDCDLLSDFGVRAGGGSELDDVFFCEAFEQEEYHQQLKRTLNMNSREWRRVYENQDERFEFLEAAPKHADLCGLGLPPLIVDFRVFFTVPTDEVYARLKLGTRRRCRLNLLYCEHLLHRFSSFQSSVPLPKPHVYVRGATE